MSLRDSHHLKPHPRGGVGRVELDLETQCRYGGLVFVQPVMSDAKKEIGSPQIRIQSERFLETRDSIFKAALFFPDQAKIEICSDKSWHPMRDIFKYGTGLLKESFAHVSGGQLKGFIDVSATLSRGISRPAGHEV